jgi:ERCC4-type nuclease
MSARRRPAAADGSLFKPYKIPEDFALVIDTREQKPLFDPAPEGLVIVRKALKHGDYSVSGLEDFIGIERKRMSDLMSYIGSERDRTVRKLEAMRPLEFRALVVEEPWDDVFLPKAHSQLSPDVIRAALVSFNVRFGLHIFMHPHRSAIERWTLDRLIYFFNNKRKV